MREEVIRWVKALGCGALVLAVTLAGVFAFMFGLLIWSRAGS